MSEPVAAPTPVVVAPKVVVVPAPTPAETPALVLTPAAEPTPAPESRRARATATKRLGGISINALLGGQAKTATELAEEAALAAREVVIDPESEQKLIAAKPQLIERLMNGRTRYVETFSSMKAVGNVISVVVPSREAHDELMRAKIEWLREIAEIAGVKGSLELNVIVNERVRVARPISIEDRLKHLINKNERLKDLIEKLSLDAE